MLINMQPKIFRRIWLSCKDRSWALSLHVPVWALSHPKALFIPFPWLSCPSPLTPTNKRPPMHQGLNATVPKNKSLCGLFLSLDASFLPWQVERLLAFESDRRALEPWLLCCVTRPLWVTFLMCTIKSQHLPLRVVRMGDKMCETLSTILAHSQDEMLESIISLGSIFPILSVLHERKDTFSILFVSSLLSTCTTQKSQRPSPAEMGE